MVLQMTEGVMEVYKCSTGSNHPSRALTTEKNTHLGILRGKISWLYITCEMKIQSLTLKRNT